ncbi:MAG: hypothetical protein Q8P52_03160 [bacterium]|nr:hypothetical protein [bacterium]
MKYSKLDLGTIEAIMNKLGGEEGAERFLRGELTVIVPKLLEFVTSVTVPEVKCFVVSDHFQHGKTVDGVKVWLGDNFTKHFLPKAEENVDGCEIRVHKLLRRSLDLGICSEIGAEREKTFLAHLWEMLKLQPSGENGALLTNSRANIFYVPDMEGVLMDVYACWGAVERAWYMDASSVGYQCEWWDAGCFVCSR